MATCRKSKPAIAALTREPSRVTRQVTTGHPGSGAFPRNRQPRIYVDDVSGEPLKPTHLEELA